MNPGVACPRCHNVNDTQLLSTVNEWCYACPRCDIRFNVLGEIHPEHRAIRKFCPQCHLDDRVTQMSPITAEYPFACNRCECFISVDGKVFEPPEIDPAVVAEKLQPADGWSDLFAEPAIEPDSPAKEPMGDRKTHGPGSVPANGLLTVQLFLKHARHGADVVMELRSLRFNFGQVAAILGDAVPDAIVQEPPLEQAKELTMGLLFLKCARLLKQRGWGIDRLMERSKEVDEADGATA